MRAPMSRRSWFQITCEWTGLVPDVLCLTVSWGELTGSDSMVVHPPQLRLKAWSSSTAGAKEDCIFCLFVEGSNADIGGSWSAPSVLGIWRQKRAQLTREEDRRSRVDATFFLCRMMMVMMMVMMMMVPTCILSAVYYMYLHTDPSYRRYPAPSVAV